MRSPDVQQLGMFSYVSVEDRVPSDHPIRKLRVLVDSILGELDGVLAARYAESGRPSIPPERLLRAALLQVVYSVRSERLLMEQLDYNLLFRWFVGLNVDDPVWDHSTFSFNRERLFDEAIAQQFFEHTVLLARMHELVSDQHFSVDGTLLEAWASHKSFRPKDGSDDDGDDFHGQKRSNDTHASTTSMKKSLLHILASLKHLPDRTPEMAFGSDASEAFAEVAPYRDGAAYVAWYSGSSEWERHPNGDEIVMALEGTTTVVLLENAVEERVFLTEMELVVIPAGVWHRFEGSERLKVLTITPQPTEHRLETPDA
jgi:transposase/mannose-6-phosphate isomerase-like protein (cupin superfamily)